MKMQIMYTHAHGDTDVPMRRRDCSWLPISRRETSRRCTRPQTPTISCIIFTCHSSYPTFYNWWPRLRHRSRLCLEQAYSRNQICHITTCFQTSTENSSFRLRLTLVKGLKFFTCACIVCIHIYILHGYNLYRDTGGGNICQNNVI